MLYDYKKDPCSCPKCKGFGIPWAGYFTCESCESIFYVETGQEVEVYEGNKVRLKEDLDGKANEKKDDEQRRVG